MLKLILLGISDELWHIAMPVEGPSTASTTEVEEMSSAAPLPRQGTRITVSIFDAPVPPVYL